MINRALMFASDNVVRDALTKQRKLTNGDLKSLFISRGILVSKETSREDLAVYFSRLSHDYYDHQAIAKVMGIISRREKASVTYVHNKFSKDDIEAALLEVRDDQQKDGDQRKVTSGAKVYELRVDYQQIDYGKSEFSQIVNKDAVISISETDEGLSIRWPLNDYVGNIKERFLDILSNKCGDAENLRVEEIELSSILDPELRTKFFLRLINLIDGYQLYDVSDVYVFNAKDTNNENDDQDNEDSHLGTHITKASLSGEGVLNSRELKSLYDKGFYISKVIWTAKINKYDSNIYNFEAQFYEPKECKSFSYLVRGFYKYQSNNNYNKTLTCVSTSEETAFLKLIERAAKKALNEIRDISNKGS